jgi:aquaporin related protein
VFAFRLLIFEALREQTKTAAFLLELQGSHRLCRTLLAPKIEITMGGNILPIHKDDRTETPSTILPNTDTSSPSREKKSHRPHRPHRKNALHGYVNNFWRNEIVAALAEFAGTFMFLFFAFGGTQVANTAAMYSDMATAGQGENDGLTQAPNTSVLLYISLIFGFSLMVNVWVFFRVSGGLFNPAVRFHVLPTTTT